MLALSLGFSAFGLFILWEQIPALHRARGTRAWPRVAGRVVASAVTTEYIGGKPGAVAAADVEYTYAVEGRPLRGTMRRQRTFFNAGTAAAVVRRYPPGTVLSVAYDPHQPEVGFVEPVLLPSDFVGVGLGLFLLVPGLLGLLAVWVL